MKKAYITTALLALSLMAGCVGENEESQAKLRAEAKVSEKDARELALSKVPGGKIKETDLEHEKGHLQWSFDVATPGSKDITEVNIDAITGEVLSVSKEAGEKSEKGEKEEKEKD